MPSPRLERILLVRTDRIGDLLMNVPLVRRLRQNHPKSSITVLASEASAPVLSRQPDIDEVLAASGPRLELARALRRRRFDAVVVSNPDKFFHFIAWASGAGVRAGFRRKWGFFLNRPVEDAKSRGDRHEIDSNLELADAFCPEKWDGTIDLGFGRDASFTGGVWRRFGLESETRKVAVHVSTTDPRKQWPLENFGALIRGLLEETPVEVVLVGSALREAERAALGVPADRVVDLTGRTTLPELAAVLSQADLLISLDSGPYHIAWMQKTPVVGLFIRGAGGSNPARWGAYPGFAKAFEIFKPASEISAGEVLEAARATLSAGRGRSSVR